MDFPFIKEALAQLFSKPSTVQYPFEPAPAKPNYRGRIVFHPDKCINCNMCERVCAGQAISHVSEPCEEGERITRSFYLGSCTFCSHCASFCTHGAIELSDDYHMVADYYHAESFEEGEQALIVSGTMIKKAPVKKPAPPPAAAAAPAPAPKVEEKPAETKKEEAPAEEAKKPKAKKADKTVDAGAKPEDAVVTEEAPAKKPRAKKAAAAADAAQAEAAVVTEEAPKKKTTTRKKKTEDAAAEAPKAEEAVPAPVAPPPAAPQPRDDGKPVQDPSKCVYCTLCARNCPAGALTVDRKEKTWTLDEDLCVACGTCQSTCPKDAIIM